MEKWATYFGLNAEYNQSSNISDKSQLNFTQSLTFNFFFLLNLFRFLIWFIFYKLFKQLVNLSWNFLTIISGRNYNNKLLSFFFQKLYISNLQTNISLYSNNRIEWFFKSLVELYQNNFSSSELLQWRSIFRLKHDKINIYKHVLKQENFSTFFNIVRSYLFFGLKSLWKGLRLWVLPLVFGLGIVYYGLIIRVLPFNKIVFLWLSFFMVFYWLMSGFVFFFKKYQFGKYTSAIQRFWRRSFILFWLLESCLLVTFVYLTLIASQESFFMYDQIQLYKTHLFSWRIFLLKIFPIGLLLLLAYFFLLTVKWNVFSKHSIWLLTFTFILTYVVWLEFYQFFHITNFYGNLVWNYDIDEKLWSLDLEARRTRIVNHYMMWLLILKFWHLLFVYAFWLFFVLRSWEKTSTKYTLLAANHQNLIILFLMSWLIMLPWIKIYFRRFMDIPYFWFYVNNRILAGRLFFNDLKIFWYGIVDFSLNNLLNYNDIFKKIPFFYWIETNSSLLYNQTRKHYIRNVIIDLFNI